MQIQEHYFKRKWARTPKFGEILREMPEPSSALPTSLHWTNSHEIAVSIDNLEKIVMHSSELILQLEPLSKSEKENYALELLEAKRHANEICKYINDLVTEIEHKFIQINI